MARGPNWRRLTFSREEVMREHKMYEESRKAPIPVDPGGGTPDRGGRRSATTLHRVKRYDDDLPMTSDWMK